MRRRELPWAAAVLALGSTWAVPTRAVDLPPIGQTPLRLDVTEFVVASQRFDARVDEGERFEDQGWGSIINRLNLALHVDRFTVGARLDSSTYWLRPEDRTTLPSERLRPSYIRDGASRFRDAIYPAKLWVTYSAPGVEATLGDAYVQFGRGMILSMRKIDDLGIDTTLRGAKISVQKDPFAATLVAGIANPSRVDEATGRALFLPVALTDDPRSPQPLFGSDRIVGAEIQAGRGLPVVLSTHAVRLSRCAPFRYDARGNLTDGGWLTNEIGTCDEPHREAWVDTLPAGAGPTASAKEILVAGQSLEIPSLAGFGNLYLSVATQKRRGYDDLEPRRDGTALYASYAGTVGRVTNTLEVKSYRNFYPMTASVDITRASAFANVLYSQPPTTEVINQDSAFGFFNACVNGGRLRTDVRLTDDLLVYGQGIYAFTKSELVGGNCDQLGRSATGSTPPDEVQNRVIDGLLGVQWQFDKNRSYLYAWGGGRDDRKGNGESFYREQYVQYTFSKWIGGPFSVELLGRHRLRFEETQNLRGDGVTPEPWREGENYTALKVAPKWIVSHGFEYTTRLGYPTYYDNGSVLYRFTEDSNIRIFVGQQRGGLRCVSGVCRVFPAFEGARAELTLRF